MGEPTVELILDTFLGTEAYTKVSNATIVRPISVPTNWRTLKLGVRFIMSGSVGNITGTPRFHLGFCSGSNYIGDATPDFFIGYRSNTATWTYTSSSTYTREYYTYGVGNMIVNIGGNVTASGDIVGSTNYSSRLCGVYRPDVMTLEVTRSLSSGENKYRLIGAYVNENAAYTGFSQGGFLRELSTEGVTYTQFLVAFSSYTTTDLGFSGGFDSVVFSWDKEDPAPSVAILDIAVASFY